jgi:hypothetical protein
MADPITLDATDARFLAARLRRLFAHFGIPVPNAEDDEHLIGNAGAAIGMLLTRRETESPSAADHAALYEYAQLRGLDYNELCRVFREACGGVAAALQASAQPQEALTVPAIPMGVLRQHWLHALECDHDKAMDRPHCACCQTDLGWHPSIGAAVEAWLAHVAEAAAAPTQAQQPAQQTDLHAAIMNLPCKPPNSDFDIRRAYEYGHRDARHAAAELVAAAPQQPAQQAVRMLTDREIEDCECGTEVQTGRAVERKFCEVNGIELPPAAKEGEKKQ